MKCGWFFGSHGCDDVEGHGPLPTSDGGYCAHRCGCADFGWCSEIRPANEGETVWLIRQHWDNEGWGDWYPYSAPFRVDAAEQFAAKVEEWAGG